MNQKRTKLQIVLLIVINCLLINYSVLGQIEDIKNKSKENREQKNHNSSDNNNDGPGSDIAEGCFSSCMDVGCNIFVGAIGEYTGYVYAFKSTDPTILSLDINANFAMGYHSSQDKSYTYVNYLPGLRANLASFILDFRYNILTEYTGNFPDAIKSWHLDLAFNIVPVETFKLAVGMGVQREQFSNSYFHEYFLASKIGLSDNVDYLDIDLRASVDYETKAYPFFETGLHYNKRIINFPHLYGYISLGALYQNYYTSHDIWALRGGVIFNWH